MEDASGRDSRIEEALLGSHEVPSGAACGVRTELAWEDYANDSGMLGDGADVAVEYVLQGVKVCVQSSEL